MVDQHPLQLVPIPELDRGTWMSRLVFLAPVARVFREPRVSGADEYTKSRSRRRPDHGVLRRLGFHCFDAALGLEPPALGTHLAVRLAHVKGGFQISAPVTTCSSRCPSAPFQVLGAHS